MLHTPTESIYLLPAPFFGIDLYLYVLVGREQVVLIDSGIATTPAEYIIPALEQAGLGLDLLVCTHGHVDHFGGNAALRAHYPSLRIALHHADVAWAEDHERHLHEMYMCMPQTWQFADGGAEHLQLCGPNTAVDLHLEHGQQIDLGTGSFHIIHTPGHSPGHSVFYDPVGRVALCGDVALGKGVRTPAGTWVPPYYADPTQYAAGVVATLALQADLYYTGHHGVLNQSEMQGLAAESLAFVDTLARASLAVLDAVEPRSLAEVVARVAQQLPEYDVGFHLHASVQAHLQRHCFEGHAHTRMIDNRTHYLLEHDRGTRNTHAEAVQPNIFAR